LVAGAPTSSRTATILRSPAEFYAEWRDLERLPEIMSHVESVTPLVGLRSYWVVRGPGDTRVTWEAEIVFDEAERLIAWRSVGQADMEHAGSVRFTPAPGNRGTEVKVILTYAPPAGRLGVALATLLGRSPDQDIREDLRRVKQRMEAGDVPAAAKPRNTRRFEPLVGLSEGLRAELALEGLQVTICPGLMRTGSPRSLQRAAPRGIRLVQHERLAAGRLDERGARGATDRKTRCASEPLRGSSRSRPSSRWRCMACCRA
jgi:uncharacterized membrane protein